MTQFSWSDDQFDWHDFVLVSGAPTPTSREDRFDAASAMYVYELHYGLSAPLANPAGQRARSLVRREAVDKPGDEFVAMARFHNGQVNIWTTKHVYYIANEPTGESLRRIPRASPRDPRP
jgi:hypothetical protein